MEPGDSCANDDECCAGASCESGVCTIPCTPGQPCTADALGECRHGTTECTPSEVLCVPGEPVTETCNNEDDDCNGKVDDIDTAPCTATSISGCHSGFTVTGRMECVGGDPQCVAKECDADDPNATDCYCTSCGAAIGGNGPPCGACSETQCIPSVTACLPDFACAGAAGDEECRQDNLCIPGRTCWTPADVQLPPNHCYY